MVSDGLVLWPPKYLCTSIHVSPFLHVENMPSSRGTIKCLIQLLHSTQNWVPLGDTQLFLCDPLGSPTVWWVKKVQSFLFLTLPKPLCIHERWKWSRSVMSDSLGPPWLLRPWDFPGKSTGVGCHFLLQGIFPTQGLNPGLLHCRQTLYPLSHQGSPYIPTW